MNVLLLSTPLDRCCGVSRHLMLLGEGLRGRGHRVILMTRGGSLVEDWRALGLEHRLRLLAAEVGVGREGGEAAGLAHQLPR